MRTLVILMMTAGLIMIAGCGEDTPSRDHIPVLKERIYLLQKAIKSESRASIDSLLSPDILKVKQGADSLLNFCWGADRSFAFDRLGDCGIVYTDKHAISDCFVMDSTSTRDHPVRLTWVYQHKLWLLQRFETREVNDSL